MKRTFQPKKKKARTFLKRMKKHYSVIVARRAKGRWKLTK